MTGLLADFYSFKQILRKQGLAFCFSGPISQNLLAEIGDTMKMKMELEDIAKPIILRVFSMIVEQAQNIIHYSAEKYCSLKPDNTEEELSVGIIAVGCENDHYFVLGGNMIQNSSVNLMREKLENLRQMNKEQLKYLYKEQRKKQVDIGSRGAGLGLIEMARKSTEPIEFDIQQIDESFSFFSLKTSI
ncbi:MAG: hypothetical protein HQK77_06235 [Desulfobacterales bacterium]|nr:hypothetical protein [Desulfobacterales bacterium]